MADPNIEEIGDTEPDEGLWRFVSVGRGHMIAVAAGALFGIVAFGGLLVVERQHEEARIANAPCAPAGKPAKEVVRSFLDRVASGASREALRSCWLDASVADRWVDRLAKTGGPSNLVILSDGLGSDPTGRRLASVLAAPTWRIDADVLWPSERQKWFVLRDDGDGRWRLLEIQTPLWGVGSCADSSLGPEHVVRTFFALLEERQPIGMAECWVNTPDREAIINRYVATGGVASLNITASRDFGGVSAVRVFAQWRASPWSGDCCQRWLVLHQQAESWRIASTDASPPDR